MLSSDLEGIKITFQALLDSSPWTYDHEVLEIPWRHSKYESILARSCSPSQTEANGRLVFGLMTSDGHVNPHAPIRLALQQVKKALLGCGYEVRLPRDWYFNALMACRSSNGAHHLRMKQWKHFSGSSAPQAHKKFDRLSMQVANLLWRKCGHGMNSKAEKTSQHPSFGNSAKLATDTEGNMRSIGDTWTDKRLPDGV